ncbi:His-Xaa-Ser system radical SAM maturase HxsC [Lysobacter niastensis]|uniref:His-Xaa-Ser system radical SAM maturase HxsC n=1 Tax=Lysobacter niastensis TaxID=380629 RepID=A0ABS0BAU1_9GAMM|nr:His-Xaa-Ser system radical SAM maturase HxsC [Lysobacter niastensis]MBF6024816.1 His-Xaa-Ser system radical SAM maturase HxsC [Lysobacter niastensis]
MLALEAKATLEGWGHRGQYKVAGLQDFAAARLPLERMLLDLRPSSGVPTRSMLTRLPWAGFLVDSKEAAPPGRRWLHLHGNARTVQPGDVVEVIPSLGKVGVRYRRGSNGNVLFATERCNSFCLMCSQPPRKIEDDWRVAQLCELAELIDPDEQSLAISGGEPTLLGDGLPQVIRHCSVALPKTHLHVLSNGRLLGEDDYAASFRDLHPHLTWGVPLYSDSFAVHDHIVQSEGAFAQTVRGLYALERAAQRIEVRVVLVRPTVERLAALARFLYRNMPFVEHVALMGVEPIGFAKANHAAVWLDPVDMAQALGEAVTFLSERGMRVSLYNLPLCVLPRDLWPYARQSISDWKQDYLAACSGCAVQAHCSGFFSWINDQWRSRAIAPIPSFAEVLDE